MQDNDLTHIREKARLYKNELLKILFEPSAKPHVVRAGGQSTPQDQPKVSDIPKDDNIVGIGYGCKVTNSNDITAEESVIIYVKQKLPRKKLRKIIPPDINGMPTDIVEVGVIRSYRPIRCGSSVAHGNVTAGTLGCLVKKDGSDTRYILSNNHVLANCNLAAIGDNIIEPGPADGGTKPIAKLTDFEPLKFDGDTNYYDAAIAELLNANDVHPDIDAIGNISAEVKLGSRNMMVRKCGRTTNHTVGTIRDISADINVDFGPEGGIASFEDQLSIVGTSIMFSQNGDSGALIVDADTKGPVALLFSGGHDRTFASPIDQIFQRFEVKIVV